MPNHEPRDIERNRRRASFSRAGMRLGDLLSTCSVGEIQIMGLGDDLIMFACTRRHECVLFSGCSELVPHGGNGI